MKCYCQNFSFPAETTVTCFMQNFIELNKKTHLGPRALKLVFGNLGPNYIQNKT